MFVDDSDETGAGVAKSKMQCGLKDYSLVIGHPIDSVHDGKRGPPL